MTTNRRPQRCALALEVLDTFADAVWETLKAWKQRRLSLKGIEPKTVTNATFMQNSMRRLEVDLKIFPAPVWARA